MTTLLSALLLPLGMIAKIGLLNVQSGMQVTRGYWEYATKGLRYALPHASDALHGISGFASDADAIVLLEAEGPSFRSRQLHQVQFASEISGLQHHAFFPTRSLFGWISMGNGLISRHPLLENRALPLSGGIETRSVGLSTIDLPQTPLHLLSTHLSLGREPRASQIRQLAGIASTLPGPLVLAGDFNSADEDDFEPLLDSGFSSLATPATYPSWNPTKALQRFFARDCAIEDIHQQDARISDHLPLIATIRV